MLFNSFEFIFIYLPVVWAGYFLLARLRRKFATAWLACSSLAFYGYWDVRYVPLLLASICFNFWMGRFIEGAREWRKKLLILGVAGDLALLGYFKYTDFFLANLNNLTQMNFELPQIVLPLGISFFTFTQLAYLVDAYRGETEGYSLLTYLLFVTIFPHLIAGPIINHSKMIPQFVRAENFSISLVNLAQGAALFSVGLFKKVMIADQLSPWVGAAFARAGELTFLQAWAGALAYTFQLYFDFSAYSEMAIGLGLMFNLRFPENFRSPYQSGSIIEFWRCWHMTLGAWVKYYLYIPLGGNRLGELRKSLNLFVSMALIGLWHGAGWTFIVWGALHGLMLVMNHQWRRLGMRLPLGLGHVLTFVCVTCAWVIFRADDMNIALQMMGTMFQPSTLSLESVPSLQLAVLLALLLVLQLCPCPQEIVPWLFAREKRASLAAVLLGVMFAIAVLQLGHVQSEFLYFQF